MVNLGFMRLDLCAWRNWYVTLSPKCRSRLTHKFDDIIPTVLQEIPAIPAKDHRLANQTLELPPILPNRDFHPMDGLAFEFFLVETFKRSWFTVRNRDMDYCTFMITYIASED